MMRMSYGVVGLVVLAAVAAPVVAPFDPTAQLDIVLLKNQPPSSAHWLGTDPFSRDILSRVLYGARNSLLIAATATVVALVAGACWGGVAHLAGRHLGASLLTLADAARTVPRLLTLLCASAIAGVWSPLALAIVVGLTASPIVCRLAYAQLSAVAARPFVEAAHALGASRPRVLTRHLAPHLLPPLAATGVLMLADVMALEASLSFLGLGVRAPHVSWGGMVQDALPFLRSAWWVAAVPSVCLLVTVLCISQLADRALLASPDNASS